MFHDVQKGTGRNSKPKVSSSILKLESVDWLRMWLSSRSGWAKIGPIHLFSFQYTTSCSV